MAVRPLNGLVAITECASRFEADTAVARLAEAGIEAMVLADPAASVAPHLVTERPFAVLVRIAIADDAQQVLAWGGPATGTTEPSPHVHPTLRHRPAPSSPPRPRRPGPPLAGDRGALDGDHWPGDTRDTGDTGGPDGARRSGGAGDGDGDGDGSLRRPLWIKPVAWATAASVVLPLVISAVRAVSQL